MTGAIFATAVALSVALARPVSSEAPQDRQQGLLHGFQLDYGFPGATAAITFPDGGVLTAATGVADADTGYLLRGLVIEQVGGAAYHDLVAERFTDMEAGSRDMSRACATMPITG